MEQIYESDYSGQEVDAAVGAARSGIPQQITQINTRVTALEEDVDDLSGLPQQVATIGLKLGDLANLHTSAKTSAVAAINEVNSNLGDLESVVAFIEDDNALVGSVVRTDSSGSRKEEKFDIVAGTEYTVTCSSSSSDTTYFKFYDANDTQIGSTYSVTTGNSLTQVAPENAVSLGIISYRAINVDITTPGKIRLLKEEIDQNIADLRVIDDTLIALTTDGSLASSSQEMKATGGWLTTQVFIKEGTSLIIDKGGDAEISTLSVSLRDKSGQSVFYQNIRVENLPYTINTTADVYSIRWGCASASFVITPGTLTLSVTTKECINSIRQDITSIGQDITSIGQDLETVNGEIEGVKDEIEGVKDEIEEIKKVPFTINGLQSFEQVFTRNAKAESIQTIDCPLYGLDERIINPDNLRTRDRGIAEIPGSIFRVNCNLYKRWAWYKLQDEQGNIDFTPIRNEILNCAENHTRLHTRVFYWAGSVYDLNNLKYPTDYSEHQDLYDTYFTNSGITFQDGVAYIGSKPIILGYPSFVFWDMVKEGTLPYLDEDSSAYTGVPNYDSETLYATWYNCLSAFSQFIEQTINVSYLQSPIKIKNCIELLQGGSVGIYGEGSITNYGGHFPSTTEKLTRYFTAYITLFPDVRLSFPLIMYWDRPFYGYPTIEQILNSSNTMGKVALFIDVIGGTTGSYKMPDYNPISKSIRDVLDSDNRQIEGETAGDAIGVDAPTLLTDIYIFHMSGATLANYDSYAPLGRSQLEKAQTLIGSKFALVRSGYNYSTGKIRLDLQNLGVSKIFSPYWKITYVFRDTNGEKISSVDSNITIQDIAPNSNMYDEVGLVVSQDMTEESVTIPANTKRIYLAIVDKYGIYPNYFLLNKNRTENGEYIIATL